MTYAVITPPGAEALTLADVKAHLRIDQDDEDDLLESLIIVAREHLERVSGLALVSRAMRLYLDGWPQAGVIEIARGPVQAVSEVRIYDDAGVETSVDLAGHMLDGTARPARLWLRNRPSPSQAMNGIEIDFSAGFGEAGADVPDTLKRAMLTHIAVMYEFRGVVPVEAQPAAVPDGYDRLVAPFAIRRL
jgi:uncharacterized phiE125 gp8 family phage protein